MVATEMPYARRSGGGTVIEHMHHPMLRRQLTADMRERMRQDQRRQVIDHIAKLGDLPFHLAVMNIESWQETEEEWQTERHFMLPRDERPVVLRVRVRLRQVRWIAETPQEAR